MYSNLSRLPKLAFRKEIEHGKLLLFPIRHSSIFFIWIDNRKEIKGKKI